MKVLKDNYNNNECWSFRQRVVSPTVKSIRKRYQHLHVFPDTALVHKYPVNLTYECASFWIHYEYGIMWMLNPDNFLSSDVARSNPVLYREYCIMASSTHALLPIFPEESWVLGWIQIRVGYVWTGKFDLKVDTCGRGNFWIRKEKVVESQISDTPFQAAIFKSKT